MSQEIDLLKNSSYEQKMDELIASVNNKTGNIDLSNVLKKENVLSEFTGSFEDVDLTKVPDMNVIKASHEQVEIALGDKVSKTDIIDTLVSEDTDAPLSANQGKVLDGKITVLGADTQKHISNGDIHTTKEAKEACANHIADENIHLSEEQVGKIDEVDNKVSTDAFKQHTSSTDIHMTAEERIKWNKVENKVDKEDLNARLAQRENYSTSEQVVGSWIDGKTLYQKTVDFGTLPNANSKTVKHGIANVDLIWINQSASFAFQASTGQTWSLVVPTMGQTNINVDRTSISLWAGGDRTSCTGLITLNYTKTTD